MKNERGLLANRPEKLRQEADHLLDRINLWKILQPFGKAVITGSYYLNVMVYPDVDIYLPEVSLPQLFSIGAKIAGCNLVTQVVYEPSDDPVNLPGGLYLKARLKYGDWGRPWKIDIWSLGEEVIQLRMADMQHFREKMTPSLRDKIVQYKLSILTTQHRTPMYSGYYIYKAFIDEGLVDFSDISRYLVANGIQLGG